MRALYVLVPEEMVELALRYCLGRKTYVVSDFVDETLLLLRSLSMATCAQMLQDLERAFQSGSTGHRCDTEDWERLRAALRRRLEEQASAKQEDDRQAKPARR